MRALLLALLGAVAGVTLCALVGAIQLQTHVLLHGPNADLRPDTAWLLGAVWFAIGFGPAAGAVGAVVGLLVGLFLGKSRSSGGEG